MTPSALAPEMRPEVILPARGGSACALSAPALEDGGEALRLAPVHVEDLLLRPSAKSTTSGLKISYTAGRRGHRRRRFDWCRDLRPARRPWRFRLMVIDNSEPALHAVLEALAANIPA